MMLFIFFSQIYIHKYSNKIIVISLINLIIYIALKSKIFHIFILTYNKVFLKFIIYY